jgi:ribosomal protein S18 acetylase RimI-like enzyme
VKKNMRLEDQVGMGSSMDLPEFTLRRASVDDLATLVAQRRAMFCDMGYLDHAALDSMSARFGPWLQAKMNAGDYLAWLAIAPDGSIAAGAGLWLMDWLPHMIGSSSRRGNIVNVYTDPKFRRRGLARRLMEEAVQRCRENGVDVVILHASPEGRELYESMGFQASNEMRLKL